MTIALRWRVRQQKATKKTNAETVVVAIKEIEISTREGNGCWKG